VTYMDAPTARRRCETAHRRAWVLAEAGSRVRTAAGLRTWAAFRRTIERFAAQVGFDRRPDRAPPPIRRPALLAAGGAPVGLLNHDVVPRAPVQGVGTGPTGEHVVAGTAEHDDDLGVETRSARMAVAARGVEPPFEDIAWDHERPGTTPSPAICESARMSMSVAPGRIASRAAAGSSRSSPRRASARRSSIVIRAIGAQAYGPSALERTGAPIRRRRAGTKLVASLQAPPRLRPPQAPRQRPVTAPCSITKPRPSWVLAPLSSWEPACRPRNLA
jgi:hypothetical protein